MCDCCKALVLDFRADINGLRAIAVSAKLPFHFKVPSFDGGSAGVAVFVVIFGYVMTAVVGRQVDDNTFSINHLY